MEKCLNREVIQPMNSLSVATRSLIPNLGDEGNREYVYQKISIHTGDERVIEAVKESVDVFVKNEPQFDDMTMLCVDFKAYYRE